MTNNFDLLINILSIIGALALFLLGMKLMSEALQRITGDGLRKLFSNIARNRFLALAAGFLVTALIQSSSAVTLMMVSFINAGLLSMSQGLGIMIGANIGTTITGWLIALFGFRFDYLSFLLPVMGLSLPLMFIPGARNRSYGEFLMGLAILFLGLHFMRFSISIGSPESALLYSISHGDIVNFGDILFFTSLGVLLTVIFQSSSATIALTFVLCFNGWLSFEAAAAMILGQNLGTTLSTNLSARHANAQARRIALSHTLFNFIGLIWALVFFRAFAGFSANIAQWLTRSEIFSADIAPIGLAAFHTLFNLITGLLLITFLPWFKSLAELIIPLRPNEKKNLKLTYFKSRFIATNEVNILQAREEIHQYGQHVAYMFSLVPKYLIEKRELKFSKIQKRIVKLENQADDYERSIEAFITKIAENDLSEANSRKIRSMLKIIDDIESIADQCMQMERTIRRKNEANSWFTQPMRDDLNTMFTLVSEALETMNANLSKDYRPGILAKATQIELKINELRDKLIVSNKLNVETGQYSYQHAEYYAELLNQCEKLADHVINVNQAIASNVR